MHAHVVEKSLSKGYADRAEVVQTRKAIAKFGNVKFSSLIISLDEFTVTKLPRHQFVKHNS